VAVLKAVIQNQLTDAKREPAPLRAPEVAAPALVAREQVHPVDDGTKVEVHQLQDIEGKKNDENIIQKPEIKIEALAPNVSTGEDAAALLLDRFAEECTSDVFYE
jgi:hypothetical protein